MDVGCYPISMARLVAGCEPCEMKAVGRIGPVSRVDEQAAGVMLFPNGIVASITCATQVSVDKGVTIFGSEGDIHIPVPWKPPAKNAKLLLKRKGTVEEVLTQCEIPLYGFEALHVSENLSKLQSPVMTWAASIGNQVALDALRKSMGLKFDCE
jgi:predicted dehydrogenase